MDSIASSTKLLYFFGLIFFYVALLIVSSIIIWCYSRFKKIALVSYIIEVILTILGILVNMNNILIFFSKGQERFHVCFIGGVLMAIATIFLLISIILYRKNRFWGNTTINLSSLIVVFTFFQYIKLVNLR